jgi:hypothetical protein
VPEVFAHLVELLGPWWPIGIIALIAGGITHHFAEADLETAAGRQRVQAALEEGSNLRRLYVRGITHGLNWLDRFMGDAGRKEASLPSPFGNRERHSYWTG